MAFAKSDSTGYSCIYGDGAFDPTYATVGTLAEAQSMSGGRTNPTYAIPTDGGGAVLYAVPQDQYSGHTDGMHAALGNAEGIGAVLYAVPQDQYSGHTDSMHAVLGNDDGCKYLEVGVSDTPAAAQSPC